ncbi:M4 family metallopeptidase, partial [Streptomyces sp. NPDC004726]
VALPSGTAGAAPATAAGPDPSAAPTRAGALPVKLSRAHQADLLADATAARSRTAAAIGLGPEETLLPTSVLEDADGTVHTRYERAFDGLPVLGGDLVVHATPSGAVKGVTRATSARISVPSTTPARSAASARASSLSRAKKDGTRSAVAAGAPRAVVWAATGRPVLAWETVVEGAQPDGTPSELHVVTDATTGAELNRREAVMNATGNSRHSGRVPLVTSRFGSLYNLTDIRRGSHRVYDMEGQGEGSGKLFTDNDDIWGDGTSANRQTDAVDAAYGAQVTWDYFADVHDRYGIRNDGDGASSRVHFQRNYAIAFWQDSCFCVSYGDGGTTPYTSIDIAAHELAHGLNSSTAKLYSFGEAAGLSEASSDIFAAAVEFHADNSRDRGDYMIGENVDIGGVRPPLRHMDRPSQRGRSTDYWHPRFTSGRNSAYMAGPATHWFYLASEGSGAKTVNGVAYNSPTHDGLPVTGIGRAAAERIWYRALTLYMVSTTDYAGARAATLAAAADLYGRKSATYRHVMDAWGAVNVGVRHDNPAPRPAGPVFENTTRVPIPDLPAVAESPITVTGVPGKAPTILLVDLHLVNAFSAKTELVAPDGTVYPLASNAYGETGSYIATLGVDASSETANGTWTLRVYGDMSTQTGPFIHSWKLSF